MASRLRAGNPTAFWNATVAGAGATSNAAEVSRSAEHILIYVTTSAATTISVEVAASSTATSEGVWPDTPGTWHPLVNPGATAQPVQHVFGAAGSAAIQIPDFVAGAVRLKTSGAATLTAGYETIGD